MELRNEQDRSIFQATPPEEILLAIEGYKFYSQEAEEFAAASAGAMANVFNLDDSPYLPVSEI